MEHLLVVGAGPGIPLATARRLGTRGYAVGLVARREEELAELQSDLAAHGVLAGRAPAEAADPASLTAALDLFLDTFGPAGVLLVDVPAGRRVTVPELAPEDLLADLAAGAVALQTAVRAVLPGMRERGSGTVLVTVGGAADRSAASTATIGVQEAALRALTEAQARALAPEGVHVATVTVRGLAGVDRPIDPDRVAALCEELVAETAGPPEAWRTTVDL
ncbi:SDR family NAD(P)-dependent oxidoreductase [Geodermatophilus sp. SYSU D01186]